MLSTKERERIGFHMHVPSVLYLVSLSGIEQHGLWTREAPDFMSLQQKKPISMLVFFCFLSAWEMCFSPRSFSIKLHQLINERHTGQKEPRDWVALRTGDQLLLLLGWRWHVSMTNRDPLLGEDLNQRINSLSQMGSKSQKW